MNENAKFIDTTETINDKVDINRNDSEDKLMSVNNFEPLKNDGNVEEHSKIKGVRKNKPKQDENGKNIANSMVHIEANYLARRRTEKIPIVVKQILLTMGPVIMNISKAITCGYSATMLAELKSPDSPIKITLNQEAWIASSVLPVMAIGCLVGGWFSDKFGRKTTQVWWCVPLTMGWLIIGFSSNYWMVLTGRLITGFIGGVTTTPAYSYIGETTLPKYRGFLMNTTNVGLALGIFLVHLYGTFLTWQTTAFVSSVFPMICFLMMWKMPESPAWLVKNGRYEEAEEALYWCKGFNKDANVEMKNMMESESKATQKNIPVAELIKDLKQPQFWKPFLIINFGHLVSQCTGNNVICFYAVTIAKETIGDSLNEYLVMLSVDISRVIMSATGCVMLKYFGTRPCIFLSGYGSAISMLGLSASIFFSESLPFAWIPFTLMIAFISFITLSLMPIPWNLTGELYPLNVRSVGGGASSFIAYMIFFFVIKTAPFLFHYLGKITTYAIYGSFALFGTTILFFILPETSGKTLQEIENGFKRKSDRSPLSTNKTLL